jgi:hypothetical protein
VAYPFAVDGLPWPDYCSSPGHRLFCINTTTLVIYMTSGGSFQVTGVDYGNHVLTVVDQTLADQTCPHNYHNTTIDTAAFAYTDQDRFLTAYVNCSSATSSLPLVDDVFSCVTGGTSYYRMDNGTLAADLLGVCSSSLVVPYDADMAELAGRRERLPRGRRERRVLGEVDGRRRVVRRVPGLRWALRAR